MREYSRGLNLTWPWTGFPAGSAGKDSACSAGDLGSILGLRRSPGEGKGYPLQHSDLENSMDCIAHGVTKSGTRLSHYHFHLEELEIPLRSDIGPEDEHQFSAEKGHTHKHFHQKQQTAKVVYYGNC